MSDTNTYRTEWTGRYPNLCSGEWHLYCNGTEIELPELVKHEPMYTYGTHSGFHFEENWEVRWENYKDGLEPCDWIEKKIRSGLVKSLNLKILKISIGLFMNTIGDTENVVVVFKKRKIMMTILPETTK